MAIPQPIRKPLRAVYRRAQAEVLVGRIALHTLDTDLMQKARSMQAYLYRRCRRRLFLKTTQTLRMQ